MASQQLHFILPSIGGLIVLFVLLGSVRRRRKYRQASRIANFKAQPKLQVESVAKASAMDPLLDAKPAKEVAASNAREQQRAVYDKAVPINPDDVIVLNIMALPGKVFLGYDLLQALLSAGFRFGDMDIFHRHEEMSGKGRILFSLASAVEPGAFDMDNIGSFSCPGVTIFMAASQVKNPLAVFDLMLTTARQLTDDLGGVLKDNRRMELTLTRLGEIKAQLENNLTKTQQQLNLTID